MPSNTTFKMLSAFILMLILSLFIGYFIGSSTKPKTVTFNDCPTNATSSSEKTIAREKTKTNLTAKEAADFSLQEALGWAKDSYISEISLSSKQINTDGASNGWIIVYYSKEKNKSYEILIKDGESRGGEEKKIEDKKTPQTLKGEMVDSIALAKSFFEQNSADTEVFSLRMYYDAGAKKFIWTMFYPKGTYTVDAEK